MGILKLYLSAKIVKIVHVLILIGFLTIVFYAVFVSLPDENVGSHSIIGELSSGDFKSITKYSECEVVHIGVVYTGYRSNFNFYTMLKSIYLFRNNPLHLHIIVDDASEETLHAMFDTWDVPQVSVSFYHINNFVPDLWWIPKMQQYLEISDILKLTFPKIISEVATNKIVVIDPDLMFAIDVYKLWDMFNYFNGQQAIGLAENQNVSIDQKDQINTKEFKTGVILYHLESLKIWKWYNMLTKFVIEAFVLFGGAKLAYQDIINAVVKNHSDLVYPISCHWLIQLDEQKDKCFNNLNFRIMQWKSSSMWNAIKQGAGYHAGFYKVILDYNAIAQRRTLYGCENNSEPTNYTVDKCSKFLSVQKRKFRKVEYLKEFKYTVTENDVTIVSQLTFDRLDILEELINFWEGPASITFYVTDAELQQCMHFIESSPVLGKRTNIGYHVVFKEGRYHPINELRNVALRNVVTPYVFLNDIDFIPMNGTYLNLKKHVGQMQTMEKMALIVPAFETKGDFPITKMNLLKLQEKEIVLPIKFHGYFDGHAPTNYPVWETAEAPYKVDSKPSYEPYVIVQRNVTGYDRRFFGYGFDKVSHIMELYKQGYEFMVLPDVFTVHKDHLISDAKMEHTFSELYRKCLQERTDNFTEELDEKYGFDAL